MRKLETLNNKSSHPETHLAIYLDEGMNWVLGIMRFWSFTVRFPRVTVRQ